MNQQKYPLGAKISKLFEDFGEYFDGHVENFDEESGLYRIKYEDGDEEEFDDDDMALWVTSQTVEATMYVSARGRLRKRVSYAESEDEEEPDEESDLDMDDSDDDLEFDSDDEDDQPKKKKARNSGTSKASPAAKKKGKSMAESFKPTDTPLFWQKSLKEIRKDHQYLDPCGMEATDDIIDRLVGEQVLKMGKLLQRALQSDDKNALGSSDCPLKLGTACSGTDAPALGLTMVQEQMERFGLDIKLNYEHVFSCEKEPFKQSYLARNFDSVLYPDIVKMTDDEPRDVYGRVTCIPKHNIFVAGTSCKNFSMLNSTKRLDIEDKGCSGETFLGAVEVLFQEKPRFAIFENVTKAPWEKMQEYITGRVLLGTVDKPQKAIQSMESKDKKTKELHFEWKDGGIVATAIPMQVGVRCGAAVKGFLKGKDIVKAKWPTGVKTGCTLNELLQANPNVDAKNDTLVFDTPRQYCTCIQKVDTKNYGLPQTRERTYMFVWLAEDSEDDLGIYWQALVKFLQSPVRHSLEAFILDPDHENIRVFREALHGPPGRYTKRAIFQASDFWTSGNANLKHNKIARERLGLEDMTRDNTSWGERGKKQIPPHYWLEYLDLCAQRDLDALDIHHGSSARDAETHDSNFASFFWNISQNVSKEKHRTKIPGIAGCISPGGEFFVSNLGRPLLGCEKLLLQGIPYFRLALGNETEVQLGDLAGNAMSLTVVCATLLAAIGCIQLRKENPRLNSGSSKMQIEELLGILGKSASMDHSSKGVVIPAKAPSFERVTDASSAFVALAGLATEAVISSVWCTCETSGRNSVSNEFMNCQFCRISCCSACLGSHKGYQMKSHDVTNEKLPFEDHHMGSFLSKLRDEAPATLVFDETGIASLACVDSKDSHRVGDLYKLCFNLQKIQRQRRKWVLHYNARDNDGVGEVCAEFRVTIGELYTQVRSELHPPELGMKGELISYFPAKTVPLVPGQIEPCAIMVARQGGQCNWCALGTPTSLSLKIKGENPQPSIRAEIGLTDKSYDSLKHAALDGPQRKHFAAAKKRGEERRWMYPSNWKEWPGSISIESEGMEELGGVYKRLACRQTVNQSAIWMRDANDEAPALYLVIKPNVERTGSDGAVISSSISAADFSAMRVALPGTWQPCDALLEKYHVQKVQKMVWMAMSEFKCFIPTSTIQVTSGESITKPSSNPTTTISPDPSTAPGVGLGVGPGPPTLFLHLQGLSDAQMSMLYPFESAKNKINLNVHSGVGAQKIIRAFNYLCVPPILKYAAKTNSLSHQLSPTATWNTLDGKPGSFGYSEEVIPTRPSEEWKYDEERETWTRKSSAEESKSYYMRLQSAKTAFEFVLNRTTKSLAINCIQKVAAHHAARFLLDGRGIPVVSQNLVVSYRMADVTLQADPSYKPFKVFPCKNEMMTEVPLKKDYCLYKRQQKVVTKMHLIESGQISYQELEMAEQEMPGSTGFSLIARATRDRRISGGVVADAIGAGKTVISIALILKGLEQARKSRKHPRFSGASLVVVPCGLIDQWAREIDKFTAGVTVVCIHSIEKLKKVSVKEIVEADVVIFPVDIIESKEYTANLAAKSGTCNQKLTIPELPNVRKMGQTENPGAFGVWIPASSRDPYGTGSATELKNQRTRELSAYFTYSYNESISRLRQKTFKDSDKGVPLEYFSFERIFVDEIHECLMSEKDSLELEWFVERNRRASRELLGIAQKDVSKRPLVYRKGIYGLTGTPLLDNSSRVIELANLIGCTYIIGLASHWRKLERESRRDIFLQQYLEPKQSREIRKAIYSKCQEYLKVACCRNTTEKELEGIKKVERVVPIQMTAEEVEAYINSQHGIEKDFRGLDIRPGDFDPSAGHDISRFLKQNARAPSRGKALVSICKSILDKDATTKIIVFTDGRIGAGQIARKFLEEEEGLGCTCLDGLSVEKQNEMISFYQRVDVTEEDRERPRVLVLHFEHAAGLNLQTESYNLILFTPLYVGDGGVTGDPVSDASTEQQAIGRVHRPGQLRPEVFVHRIELQGPEGEECLDGYLIGRNTNKETLQATTNAAVEENEDS